MNKHIGPVCVRVCLLFVFAACLLAAQTANPPAAEQQAKAWLAAFNTGDRATLLDYLKTNYPPHAEHVDDELRFRGMTGGFDLEKVEESTATHFVALLKEKESDQFARLTVDVDTPAPHQITKFELWAIARPAEFAIPRLRQPEAIEALKSDLEHDASADRFSGAALVAKDGKVLFENAHGMADREKKTPNTVNTKFRIGSMNKMFTAVSILQLVQAGKIQLTDPLGKYLPDYANKNVATKVTIHQLLTHTGGTGDFFGPEFDAHREELKTLQDYVKLYEKRDLKFEPGSKWEYSNYGFLLLGVVIEKVSGQSYYDYVQEHVFKPAGMESTGSLPENQTVAERSVGYMQPKPGAWQPNTDTLPYRGTSAGGGYSTVGDLFRFATALTEHKLLDAKHTDLLISGKVDTGRGGDKYAYGFFESTENGMQCFGHGGGAPGMNGDLKICPDAGYVIAVLSNLDPPAATRVSDFVAARLPLK
ncbi:MAG TPA: serine hydrolase domain-containing protein [Candidatus Sulfotelmatobacter sp.]|nr:serine hydrolase domain-containing protein [Candidatus Sulfotelmatobacter sp.]